MNRRHSAMKKTIWIGAILGLVAWGCGDMISNPISGEFGLRMDDSGVTEAGISKVVQANNQFALEVYSELKGKEENLFLSPYSISTALAMTYEGARGQTAEEIARVFHFPTDDPERRAAFAAVHNRLNEAAGDYTLRVANALWAQKDYPFLEAYLSVLQNYYAAKATNVDFMGATETARQTINAWVEERTERKIKDLFPRGTIDESTRLVLTNAIYFKGQWVTQFDRRQTRNEAFHVSPDRSVNVPMMRLTGEGVEFKYAQDEDVQVLEMPYKGEKLSMLVLLPRSGGLAAFENALTLEKLEGWRAGLRKRRVDVFMPKFTFETKYVMNEVLQKMGMPTAFSGGADFSGMTGKRDLAIQHVIHQAFVDVNEEGTEAAAATGVSVGVTSVPQVPVFRADRPFLFAIQDTGRGNLLFLGRVVNPEAGAGSRS
jgi:serpin B